MKKRIMVFMGTRPEAIKLAPVIHRLRTVDEFQPIVVATGQHREMFRQITEQAGIDVDVDLEVMHPNQTLSSLTARLMEHISPLLEAMEPDMAVVQGDTTTVFMAALSCFYRRIPVAHVEAGLRTSNIWSPFPEEINRRLTAPLVRLHFAPTESARDALLAEGTDPSTITVTGNTVIDSLLMEVDRQRSDPLVRRSIDAELDLHLGEGWEEPPMVLITGHRRENFGEGIRQICEAIRILADRFHDHLFVYPVHLNPKVKTHVERLLGGMPNIRLIPPQGYRNFVALMAHAKLILTDSGGVQEEAPSLGKPTIVMRDTTERPEGIEAGAAVLTGPNAAMIIAHTTRLLREPEAYMQMARARNPYGDGRASERIVHTIQDYFQCSQPLSASS